MNTINYQRKCEEIIDEVISGNKGNKLLIHSCCAPCSSYCLMYLSQCFEITVMYYNPNIFPRSEYEYRISEQDKLIKLVMEKKGTIIPKFDIHFVHEEYSPKEFYDKVKGHEKDKEGGDRCKLCFELRLDHTARYAKEHGFDMFTTTLSISPLKNSLILNEIGERIAKSYDIEYLVSDFKKNDGYKKSVDLSKEYGLYRQNYCGCVYSMVERKKIGE